MFFQSVIGQAAVKAHLTDTVDRGRIAHAQILAGGEGSGNLALALAYAQYVLCENRTTNPNSNTHDSCGECASCRKVSQSIHPDVHYSYPTVGTKAISTEYLPEWRKAIAENPYLSAHDWFAKLGAENKQGNITKDECADILRKLSLKAFEGSYKILILWMPEYLGKEGNRLLKLIEEPPVDTLFLLVTENLSQVLTTVLSRCQLVRVEVLHDTDIAQALCERENVLPDRAQAIANLVDGNYNEALSLARNPNAAAKAGEIDPADRFLAWFRIAYKADPTEMLARVEELAKLGREEQKYFFRYVLFFLREYTVTILSGSPSPRLREKEQTAAAGLSKVVAFEQIEPMADLMNDCIFAVERNANPKILLLDATIQLHGILRRTAMYEGIIQN